jgi:hypothetical protein
LSASTSAATSSVVAAICWSRSAGSSSPRSTSESSKILMLTSWSEQSTPALLSIASVLTLPPRRAYSMRPSWVSPRFPPSPTTATRSSSPSTRTASLLLSPTSAWVSVDALT